MVEKKKAGSKRKSFWYYLFALIWFVIKIPYYIVRGLISLVKWSNKKSAERKVEKKRGEMVAKYSELKVVKTIKGDYKKWEDKLFNSDSKIGIIIGARGSGKSAFGMRVLENMHSMKKRKCFAMGFKAESLPSWIKVAGSAFHCIISIFSPANSLITVETRTPL